MKAALSEVVYSSSPALVLVLLRYVLGADDVHLVFPIPNDQIEIVNNNDILWQNPGF